MASCTTSHQTLRVVTVPVVDLRAEPGPPATAATHDPFQETQLLYGERVRVIRTDGPWAFVEAIEQPEYTHHRRWQGYPGWIPQDLLTSLSPRTGRPNAIITARWATVWQDAHRTTTQGRFPMGTKAILTSTMGEWGSLALLNGTTGWIARRDVSLIQQLNGLSHEVRRQAILRAAEQFLGDPYFWGGRSPHLESISAPVTGVDCSGLVNLAYRTAGLEVPRDAHEQYLRAKKIRTPKPADLVFLSAPDNPRQIVHVMLYAGEGWLIEGPGTGLTVRRITVAKRLGRPLEQLRAGERIDRQTLSFGAYSP